MKIPLKGKPGKSVNKLNSLKKRKSAYIKAVKSLEKQNAAEYHEDTAGFIREINSLIYTIERELEQF